MCVSSFLVKGESPPLPLPRSDLVICLYSGILPERCLFLFMKNVPFCHSQKRIVFQFKTELTVGNSKTNGRDHYTFVNAVTSIAGLRKGVAIFYFHIRLRVDSMRLLNKTDPYREHSILSFSMSTQGFIMEDTAN